MADGADSVADARRSGRISTDASSGARKSMTTAVLRRITVVAGVILGRHRRIVFEAARSGRAPAQAAAVGGVIMIFLPRLRRSGRVAIVQRIISSSSIHRRLLTRGGGRGGVKSFVG